MVTQQAAINLTRNFVKELSDFGINLKKAYLFGSFAVQRQHEHSVIDLALVADEFIEVGPVDIKLFVQVLRNYTLIHPKRIPLRNSKKATHFSTKLKEPGWNCFELNM